MNQREKLIELLYDIRRRKDLVDDDCIDDLADELLANGVVVLPCLCGECRYYGTDGKCEVYDDYAMHETDFCSYGKRKRR